MTNQYKVIIGGKDITRHVPFPIKWQDALDETLDYSRISIKCASDEIIPPLTPVEIEMTDKYGHVFPIKQVASTDTAVETPVGRKTYNHELYSIEQTKILEGIVVEALTFQNDLGRNYAREIFPIQVDIQYYRGEGAIPMDKMPDDAIIEKLRSMKQPFLTGKQFTFPSWNSLWGRVSYLSDWQVEIRSPSGVLKSKHAYYEQPYPTPKPSALDPDDLTVMLDEEGKYTAFYEISYMESATSDLPRPSHNTQVRFSFNVVHNREPLPKWNITTVINRILDLAEPHLTNVQPRFHLNAKQAEEFAKIDAFGFVDTPEFMVPSGTLREDLEIIGGYIHGIPRLIGNEIYYDMLGETKQAKLYTKNYPYVSNTYSQDIESYCSALDSSVDNLVCLLDEQQGTIVDPYNDGYKTVRTETVYARIDEGNMYISTQMPIQKIKSVKCGFVKGAGTVGDITAYVFETSEYSRLSSYSGLYPTSKAYALYYTQGTKNIYGLNFKVPDASGGVFKNYSIINIINAATNSDLKSTNYPLLSFQVEYIPIFSARVQQTKQYIGDIKQPRTLCYNQASNLVETRYYGEHIKGLVARMGTVDRTILFHLDDFTLIPKIGEMWGDDYYISQVICELLPSYLKCQISLSKDFNRLSRYIGINSLKRFYEVSEIQAYNRDIKYPDYIVIGDAVQADNSLAFIQDIINTFTQSKEMQSVSHVIAEGVNNDGTRLNLNTVLLPIVSVACGDAMLFTCKYEDNYSAGAQASYETAGDVSGYFTNGVAYGNYYGRFPALKFQMFTKKTGVASGTYLPQTSSQFPLDAVLGTSSYPLRVDKNSAEILSLTYVLEYVTNRRNYIIGSALARNCPLVRGTDKKCVAKLYVLPNKIGKFMARVDLTNATQIEEYNMSGTLITERQMKFDDFTPEVDGASWAIVDGASGELLLGSNETITAGQAVSMPYMTMKHNIFNL